MLIGQAVDQLRCWRFPRALPCPRNDVVLRQFERTSNRKSVFQRVKKVSKKNVIARSEATWQSASPKTCGFRRTFSKTKHFGERIATPVCALVRNDRLFYGIATPVCALVRNDRFFDSLTFPKGEGLRLRRKGGSRPSPTFLVHNFQLSTLNSQRKKHARVGVFFQETYQYWVGSMCQISWAYWAMVRSEENLAAEAMFTRHFRPKVSRSA